MRAIVLALVLALAPACFTTRTAAPVPAGEVHSFSAIYILGMPQGPFGGAECKEGLASSETSFGWKDALYTAAGVVLAGGVYAAMCNDEDCGRQAIMVGAATSAAVQMRTVSYACREGSP